jgi:hypothetical protein
MLKTEEVCLLFSSLASKKSKVTLLSAGKDMKKNCIPHIPMVGP